MNTGYREETRHSYLSPTLDLWQDARVRAAVKILFLIGMGYLAALGKHLHPSMGIPGSSAPWWLMPMMLGKLIVRDKGSGLLMGATVSMATVPIGLNHTMFYNFGLYGVTGLMLDTMDWLPRTNIRGFFGAVLAGGAAHLGKFTFIFTMAMTSSITKHFLIVGVLQSFGLHLMWGVISGLLAWFLFRSGKKLKEKLAG